MNQPKFLLKDKNIKEQTLVYLVLRLHNQRLKFSTGLKINPDDWNFTKQRMKERKGLPYRNFNKIIENYITKCNNILLDLEAEGKTPTVTLVKFRLQDEKQSPNSNILTPFEYFIVFQKKFAKKNKNGVRFFKIAADKLESFNPVITWTDFNETTFRNFIKYLENKKLSANYIGTIVNRLRIMFSQARRDGYLKHTSYLHWKKSAKLDEVVPTIYLTENEIERLYYTDVGKKLEHARDLFILGCCTGLRVGNYLKLDSKINIHDGFIHAIVNKNGPKVMIPIHWMVTEIIEKYNGLPKPISEQHLNRSIKTACQIAEINTTFQWYRTQGGTRKIFTNQKWELVTSHVARRSFATNLYLRGENPKVIMAVTGHKTTQMFYRYIKITAEESSRKLAKSEFFTKKTGAQ